MIDNITTTTRRAWVEQRLGRLERDDLLRVERSLLVILGMAG